MKRFLLSVLLLSVGLFARAGEPYTCTQAGRTLEFERHKASNGRLERRTTMYYTDVRREGSGRVVECIFTVFGPGGGALYGGGALMRTTITADGTVEQDLGASVAAVLHNLFPGAEQTIAGTPARIPVDLKVGDKLPDGQCTVKTGIMTHTIHIFDREVLRFERIRVPAGEFDCVVLREHKVERGIGRNRDTISENWYAPGVGPVRHDSYRYRSGFLEREATEVLKKY
ncbi:MAG: hypothetical protein K6E35_00225 [Bacteroidales bacterium]|nr:hypothetical protein [Bacteroidales bacterium]